MLNAKLIVLFAVLSLLSPLACIAQVHAGGATGPNQLGDSPGSVGACMFQPDVGLVPGCVRRDSDGKLSIAPQYLKQLHFDSSGLVPVWSESQPYGWMYVDRKGRVVVTGVAVFDNGADTFHDDLVRVTRGDRFGFANSAGKLVIPAVYDGAFNFENGTAVVCKQCKNECHGEHCWFTGGRWLRIDTRGHIVGEIAAPN